MGKCFHPREDIKASKRIRALNSRFVRSQIIQKTVGGKLKFVSSFLHHSYTKTTKKNYIGAHHIGEYQLILVPGTEK